MNKTHKAIMHFNKPGSKKNTPWTVHYRGACYLVSEIRCHVQMVSEWKPNKKQNPRAFFTAYVSQLEIATGNVAILK
jgi:hypothetical protein